MDDLVAKLRKARADHDKQCRLLASEIKQRDAYELCINQRRQYGQKLEICLMLLQQTHRRERPGNLKARAVQERRAMWLRTIVKQLQIAPVYPEMSNSGRRVLINKAYNKIQKYETYVRGARHPDTKDGLKYTRHVAYHAELAQWRARRAAPRHDKFEQLCYLKAEICLKIIKREQAERDYDPVQFEEHSLAVHTLTLEYMALFAKVQRKYIPGEAYELLARLLQANTGHTMYVTCAVLPAPPLEHVRFDMSLTAFVCRLRDLTVDEMVMMALLGVRYTNHIPAGAVALRDIVRSDKYYANLLK